MKIAFSSKDGKLINEHFGWSEEFYIYEVLEAGYSFVQKVDASLKHDDEIDKLQYKISCLGDVDMVYVSQIGPKAANMVKSAGIHPAKSTGEDEKIEDVIKTIRNMMCHNPPLWLKRITARSNQ